MGGIAPIAKNVNREMADRACDPTAVEIESREIWSANIFASIHLHTIDDGNKITPAQIIAQCRLTQRSSDETARLPGIEIVDLLAPTCKGRNLVLNWLLSVGDVV